MKQEEDKKGSFNPFPKMEEEVLDFWEKAEIFKKSLEKEASNGDYVFYDGPPFATGEPHYGHLTGSILKDAIPRYQTMKGFHVERKWGWDCHGLPIENIAEKELGITHKQEIEEMGVDKFNEFCRTKVLSFVDVWKTIIRRLGRWADMENPYKTMDLSFMESIWWVFKQLWDKGLIYESYRSMHICPRCETTLSQSEVAEGYKMVKDLSVIAKFEIANPEELWAKLNLDGSHTPAFGHPSQEGIYILAWTTTPWTLIGNVALAVGEDIEYVEIVEKGELKISPIDASSENKSSSNEKYIIAKDIFIKEDQKLLLGDDLSQRYFYNGKIYEIVRTIKGKDLVGLKYKPLFDYYAKDESLANRENGWKIYGADFVTTDEGTGVVHIAPAFGEDDMNLGKEYNLPFIQHVGMDGMIKPEATDFAGLSVKPIGDHTKTDVEIIKYLAAHNSLFSKEKYEHSYPHCWRCETPLLNYATTSWFVSVTKIKDKALEYAKAINWSPEYIKEGRFGNWLSGARDWSISRQRYWASVIPLWKCDCGEVKVIGSVDELEKLSGQKVVDLHKHIVDKITFKCEKCNGTMKRIPDVLDTWFDSGSMPYAQMHYPFENKEKFENNFPAEFIAEGIDQTRCWFYYLHIIGAAVKDSHAFNNVIVNGIVLAEDGKKMSKRLKNYPDPAFLFDKYSADAVRYYLLSSPVVMAENLNFSEDGVKEVLRKVEMILWNVVKFYELFTNGHESKITNSHPSTSSGQANGLESKNILDQWILARLDQLIEEVTENMDKYDLPRAVRPIEEFISDLSTWYIRRSRDRFKSSDAEAMEDKVQALKTTKFVLIELSKIMAPFMPFLAEQVWQRVTGNNFGDGNKSVHLEAWPEIREYDPIILNKMKTVRSVIEDGLSERDKAGIKVRQPLPKIEVTNFETYKEDYSILIIDELNVKEVISVKGNGEFETEFKSLDMQISPELLLEGNKREIVRFVNSLRKDAGLSVGDRITLYWQSEDGEIKKVFEKFNTELMKDVLADKIVNEKGENLIVEKNVKVNEAIVWLGIKLK